MHESRPAKVESEERESGPPSDQRLEKVVENQGMRR